MKYYFWTEAFFQFGVGLIIYALLKIRKKNKYIPTEALCLKATRVTHSKGFNTIRGTFRYVYEGQEYIVNNESIYKPKWLKQGIICTLYVNPDNPSKYITEFEYKDYYIYLMIGVFGIFLPLQRYFSY